MRESTAALVLGGGGFIGTNLCRALAAAGHRVRAFGRRPHFPADVEKVDWRDGEFEDLHAVSSVLDGCEVVYHLIHNDTPQQAELDPIGDLYRNVAPTIALLQACCKMGVRRIVFVSSGGTVYGRVATLPTPEEAPTDPICAYGVSKIAVEKYLHVFDHRYGLEYRALRVANPFGPYQIAHKNQGVVAALILRALRREPIEIWGDGQTVRDFVYIDDVVDALVAAAADHSGRRIYNIGSGQGRSLLEIISAIESCLGARLEIVWRPARALDVPVSVLDVSRAREGLNWRPRTPFLAGIETTIAWAKGQLGA